MSQELARIEGEQQEVIDMPAMMDMSKTLIDSGFLPDMIKKPAQAVAIILTGRELGIPIMQALRQIHVIKGKPTMAAELMLSLAYQHVPGFWYQVVESTAEKCVCKFQRPGHEALTHEFKMGDAKALGLDKKDNWREQPATMLRWRCISSGLRLVVPDAIAGVCTPEEIMPDISVSESGTVIEGTVVPEPRDKLPEPPKKVINNEQRKRLFAKMNNASVTEETLRTHILDRYKLESTKDIKTADYDALCEWVCAGGQDGPGVE